MELLVINPATADVSELKLLKNLEPCRFKDEEKRKRSLTRGTCEWIIEENDFQNWVQNWSLENKILWILGNPGSGKTFTAQVSSSPINGINY